MTTVACEPGLNFFAIAKGAMRLYFQPVALFHRWLRRMLGDISPQRDHRENGVVAGALRKPFD
jgi:hypothetical protein